MKKFLALLLLYSCTLVLPVDAAITRGVGPTYIAISSATSGNNTLVGTTTGRSIICAVLWYDPSSNITISSIAISGESNATLIAGSKYTNHAGTNNSSGQFAYLANITAGGTKTITITFSGTTYADVACMEYAGLDTSSQPDSAGNTATGSAGAPTLSLTTTTAGALIVAVSINNLNAVTAGSGYTLFGTMPNNILYEALEDDLDASTAGAKTVDFVNFTTDWAMTAASFKASGGGGGGSPPAATAHRRIQ